MNGTLYIVSTPIGNLGDMTARAITALKEVSFIFCEDTRVTQNLLSHFEIKTPTRSFHQHSSLAKYSEVLEILKKGESVPGVSAVITALSVSGFPADKFVFMGFPPNKNKRKKYFEEVAGNKYTTVFYESNHRIGKAIRELSEVLDDNAEVFIGRELTKKFESFYKGKIKDIMGMKIPEKGEFVIVIKKA